MRGHQFRYSTLSSADGDAYRIRKRRGGATFAEGYGAANVLGSYCHVHFASNPLVAEGFVAAASEVARRR